MRFILGSSVVIEVPVVIEGEKSLAFPHFKARVVMLGNEPPRLDNGRAVVSAVDHLNVAEATLSTHEVAAVSVHLTSLSPHGSVWAVLTMHWSGSDGN